MTFFRPVSESLERFANAEGVDVWTADDGPAGPCGGLHVFGRRSEPVRILDQILTVCRANNKDDQEAMHICLRSGLFRQSMLPPDLCWTYGLHGRGNWGPLDKPDSPRGIAIHHANWTIGIENKIALLKAVEDEQR